MAKSQIKFCGTLSELMDAIARMGIAGTWEEMPTGYARCRCTNGAILNWWPRTGTINVQGRRDAQAELLTALTDGNALLRARAVNNLKGHR